MSEHLRFYIRPFDPADAVSCWSLFQNTIRRINCFDYSPEQINAWANVDGDREPWFRRFDNHVAFVVVESTQIVGFADLTRDGYLDRLFVSADHQRQGIASLLMKAIEEAASENSLSEVYTHASITAKPFFLAQGFQVITEQTVECRGVKLSNFIMKKWLSR